eukprot:3289839-Amphidinium_carterae.1
MRPCKQPSELPRGHAPCRMQAVFFARVFNSICKKSYGLGFDSTLVRALQLVRTIERVPGSHRVDPPHQLRTGLDGHLTRVRHLAGVVCLFVLTRSFFLSRFCGASLSDVPFHFALAVGSNPKPIWIQS